MNNWHHWQANYLWGQFLSHFPNSKDGFTKTAQSSPFLSLPLITLVISFVLLVLLIRFALRFRKSLQENSVLLELTPPAFTDKSAYTTQQLFSVLHGLGKRRSLKDKLLGIKLRLSFEIASTQHQGIRYIIRVTPEQANNIKRYLLSYLPQVSVNIVNEYLPENSEALKKYSKKIIEFKLSRRFAYPLMRQDALEEHDPVAYITGMMTKLSPGELISFQIILSPTKTGEAHMLKRMILRNEDVLAYLDKPQAPSYIKPITFAFKVLGKVINVVGREAQWAMTEVMHSNTQSTYAVQNYQYHQQLQVQQHVRPARMLSTFEQETIQSVQGKIDQPLFETTVRLFVMMKDNQEQRERVDGFISSLETFSVPGYQSLIKKHGLPDFLWGRVHSLTFQKRLLSLLNNSGSSLLSVSEVSDLYHFPFSRVTQTENIVKVHSKELPAPLSLKKSISLDVVFAKNTYGGTTTGIGLTEEEREKHMYIIGATGSGKSTMILSMVAQDIKNGKGVAVIDPHGDLAETLLSFVPEKRKNDLIYINPDDLRHPIGINLLELTPGLDEDDQLREKEFITESVISLFRKVFVDSIQGHAHRIEYILRNTIQTALTLENPTLFTVYDLLNNPPFQKDVIKNLKDENLKNFWKYEFGKAGDYQKVKMVAPVAARIGRFLFSPSAKRILEQKKSTVDFDDILKNEKIVIANLAKGKLGEDTSEVLGIMIITKIQLAALKRARIAQKNRKPFYLYVDEFQNFATLSFIQMLSEARKYKVYLIMAEQSTSQQKDRNLVNVILANVGTVVSFRSANPDDEKLMLPQFAPYIEKGEIANLPRYKFYIKIAAVNPEESFSGETILLEIKVDKKKIEKLIKLSRNKYAIVYKSPKEDTIKKPSEEATDTNKKDSSNTAYPEDEETTQ